MPKEIETQEKQSIDPINLAIDTPDNKMSQFTIIPTGAVNAFAMADTIQQFGKENNGKTPMEQYMERLFKMNRSRGGAMLAGLWRLAQTKQEVSADVSAEGKRFIV